MTDLCPSCREPVDHPSGDGCAAMTKHNIEWKEDMAKWKEINTPDPHAIVRAALKKAYDVMCEWVTENDGLEAIRTLADDPEAVAEIIAAAAKEGRG